MVRARVGGRDGATPSAASCLRDRPRACRYAWSRGRPEAAPRSSGFGSDALPPDLLPAEGHAGVAIACNENSLTGGDVVAELWGSAAWEFWPPSGALRVTRMFPWGTMFPFKSRAVYDSSRAPLEMPSSSWFKTVKSWSSSSGPGGRSCETVCLVEGTPSCSSPARIPFPSRVSRGSSRFFLFFFLLFCSLTL